jgi:hypothetical protein
MTFWMKTLSTLKKRFEILVPKFLKKNAIGLFIDNKILLKIVKVDHKIMLINLIPLNFYLLINLEDEDEFFYLRQ